MNGTYIEIDMSEFKKFLGSVERAAKGDFRKAVSYTHLTLPTMATV